MGCYSGNNILIGSFYRIFNFPVLNAKLQLSSGKVNTVFFYWLGLLFGGFFKALKKKQTNKKFKMATVWKLHA